MLISYNNSLTCVVRWFLRLREWVQLLFLNGVLHIGSPHCDIGDNLFHTLLYLTVHLLVIGCMCAVKYVAFQPSYPYPEVSHVQYPHQSSLAVFLGSITSTG